VRQLLFLPAAALLATVAQAQPVDLPVTPATTSEYPPGVKVVKTATGPTYASRKGQVLYGMDMRVLLRYGPDPAQYCRESCAEQWEPLLAPADARPNIQFPRGGGGQANVAPAGFVVPARAPDWTVIAGPAGPQWVYKGWHMVFTRRHEKPGSVTREGAEGLTWNTLKFVPPVPVIVAPAGIKPSFVAGAYALTTGDGRMLYTGQCKADCAAWTPLAGPLASRGQGDWQVLASGDSAQWKWRGQPVYVAADGLLPAGARTLRP
jgi:predicted lipoprotein with Yx(FWY)xxD motif